MPKTLELPLRPGYIAQKCRLRVSDGIQVYFMVDGQPRTFMPLYALAALS